MAAKVIISYDGTPNDDDGLALGRMLSAAGVELSLAYVRHSHEYDPRREEISAHDADRRLQQGAVLLGQPELPHHVVVNPSTGDGLARLAEAEGASLVVFGSDYRTSPGRVEPGGAAQSMLNGGSVPVAVAEAGVRAAGESAIRSIAVFAVEGDDAPQQTADALAQAVGASVVPAEDRTADLIVVGSQAGAQTGRIALSGATRAQLDSAHSSVIVLPHGVAIPF